MHRGGPFDGTEKGPLDGTSENFSKNKVQREK